MSVAMENARNQARDFFRTGRSEDMPSAELLAKLTPKDIQEILWLGRAAGKSEKRYEWLMAALEMLQTQPGSPEKTITLREDVNITIGRPTNDNRQPLSQWVATLADRATAQNFHGTGVNIMEAIIDLARNVDMNMNRSQPLHPQIAPCNETSL
jgi:hypothetical protein